MVEWRDTNFSFKPYGWMVLLYFILCAILPTNNSTIDAYCYAADIRFGENLFRPHHLLYNAFCWLIYQPFSFIDTLQFLKILNAAIATLGLIIVFNILNLILLNLNQAFWMTLLIFSSFGILRFATENEVYMIPFVLSVWGTLYYMKGVFENKKSYYVLAILILTIAVLFHQLMIWWLLITLFFIGLKSRRYSILLAFTSGMLILGVYSVVLYINGEDYFNIQKLIQFVLNDYYTGEAKNSFGMNYILLTGINLVRSFIQFHGSLFPLVSDHLWLWIPVVLLWSGLIFSVFQLFRNLKKSSNVRWFYYFISLAIIYILFSLYAMGNAEFMIMIPFLIIISLTVRYQLNIQWLQLILGCLIVWNIGFGLIVNNQKDLYHKNWYLTYQNEHAIFIMQEANLLKNMQYYHTHQEAQTIYKLPADYTEKNQSPAFLDTVIINSLKQGKTIYTDIRATMSKGTRKGLLSNGLNDDFKKRYIFETYYKDSDYIVETIKGVK